MREGIGPAHSRRPGNGRHHCLCLRFDSERVWGPAEWFTEPGSSRRESGRALESAGEPRPAQRAGT